MDVEKSNNRTTWFGSQGRQTSVQAKEQSFASGETGFKTGRIGKERSPRCQMLCRCALEFRDAACSSSRSVGVKSLKETSNTTQRTTVQWSVIVRECVQCRGNKGQEENGDSVVVVSV